MGPAARLAPSRRPDAATRTLSFLRYAKGALLLVVVASLFLSSAPTVRRAPLLVDESKVIGRHVAHGRGAATSYPRGAGVASRTHHHGLRDDDALASADTNEWHPESHPEVARPRPAAAARNAMGKSRPKSHWNPATYLRHALAGPRRCANGMPCYIVDVLADPYQPRLFASMLGLPATNIPKSKRGGLQNVTMVDVRTGEEVVVAQSFRLANETHGLGVALTGGGQYANETRVAPCTNLKHQKATALNAYFEGQTHACDLSEWPRWMSLEDFGGGRPVRVDVVLAPDPNAEGGPYDYVQLSDAATPFRVASGGMASEGLMNSASRPSSPVAFAWTHDDPPAKKKAEKEQGGVASTSPHQLKVSVCLIGVDYVSPQQREVVQHYLTLGFDHVYLGLPQWPTSDAFRETWEMLGDYVEEGKLSIVVSEYAGEHIQPEKFEVNFTYAPTGHKTSFLNTCLLAARAAGDDLTGVFDMDEIIEHDYGNATTIGEVLADQLRRRHLTLEETCMIKLGSMTGLYRNETAGYTVEGRIVDKLAGLIPGTDSVDEYGKSFHNVRRVLRAGLHSVAYCESLPERKTQPEGTRKSDFNDHNGFRANREPPHALRTLHLSDSYRWRSEERMVQRAERQEHVSYYARDWSERVHADLRRREVG